MELAELVQFFLLIEVFNVEVILRCLNEFAVLFQEALPVDKVTHSKTEPEYLRGIARTNTLQGRSNYRLSFPLLLDLGDLVCAAVDIGNQSGSTEINKR